MSDGTVIVLVCVCLTARSFMTFFPITFVNKQQAEVLKTTGEPQHFTANRMKIHKIVQMNAC